MELCYTPAAPMHIVQPNKQIWVEYGFGNASGSGLGSSFTTSVGLRVRIGVWGRDAEDKSSNWQELSNVVETLRDLYEVGELVGGEVFIFTDNTVAEVAYHNGTSSNEVLFELVLRLRKLELHAGAKVHVIHCAGMQMIAQGKDGLLQGDLTEGVMEGLDTTKFVPIHLGTVTVVGDPLVDWLQSWAGANAHPLEATEWFTVGQDLGVGGKPNADGVWIPEYSSGTYIWSPTPAGVKARGRATVEVPPQLSSILLPLAK